MRKVFLKAVGGCEHRVSTGAASSSTRGFKFCLGFLWNSFVSFMWKPRRKKISHNFCATIKIVFLNVYNKTAIPSAGIECLSVCDVGFVLKESV